MLVTFGADSVVERVSAGIHFRRRRRQALGWPFNEASVEAIEGKASRTAGRLLYALSVRVVLQAVYGLTHRHHAAVSCPGLAVAVVSAFGMPPLARAKIRLADRIGSRALRADAMETFTCGRLSWVLLAGLAANALLHRWWLDVAGSLVIVPLLLKEAWEAVTGGAGVRPDGAA